MAQQWHTEQVSIDETVDPIEACYQNGWTDGLPVVPPTPERVERMLSGTRRSPDELIAPLPPKWGKATVERIAINAVMAGCLPEYLPIVLAAVEAMVDERFNLHGVQVTTSHVAPMLVINGPIRKALDINDGFNLFGQGWRANATIGRAVRLICTNIGGALPAELDRAAFGHIGKYTCCIAEIEGEENPWEPLHVERGFEPEDSTVTVFAGAGPQSINDHGSNTAEGILTTICQNMAASGNSRRTYPHFFLNACVVVFIGFQCCHVSSSAVRKFISLKQVLSVNKSNASCVHTSRIIRLMTLITE